MASVARHCHWFELEQLPEPRKPNGLLRVRTSKAKSSQTMQINTHYIGADIAKDAIELHSNQIKLPASIANDKDGIKKLVGLLKKASAKGPIHLVCEATGHYHKALCAALWLAAIRLSVINPRQVRDFARAANRLAKTDKLDAQILALYGERMQPEPTEPASATQVRLEALAVRRRQLVEARSEEIKRAAQTQDRQAKASIKAHIGFLDKQVAVFDREMEACVLEDELLAGKVERFCHVQGVGKTTALMLLAAAPELGTLSKAKITALAGLAPFDNSSGAMKGVKRISGGRMSIRAALYMAAVSAARHNHVLKPVYKRLRDNGKTFKQAITAVMRKLLIHLNSLARECSPRTPAAASGAGSLRGGTSPSSTR